MDISNNEKFVKQLHTLKKCNFREYVWTCRGYILGFIIIGFMKILSEYSLKMAFIEVGLLVLTELVFYYWIFYFFRKIAYEEKFSSKKLFVGYFAGMSSVMFIVLGDLGKFVFEPNFSLLPAIFGSILFGLMMGGVFTINLNERLIYFLKSERK
ncbi:hypothetical protein FQS96_14415 [Enterococcus faecalis]|uniref:hypothetical protein n=1 Tax=Enterococcus TaxID=1350 RepID=UPI001A9597D7|nr:hypothetical protein [Enterococcus faecalis]MBO1126631.1 hypothetical protein [Enterococcus faecalis]